MTKSSPHNPLRIGIDGRELLPHTFTGFGRYIENFLGATNTRTAKHHFIIYGNQHTRAIPQSANYTQKTIEEKNTLWWDHIALVKAMHQDALDLFFTPYDKTPFRAPCPVVMTIHDLLYQYVSDLTGIKRTLYNILYRLQRGYMAHKATHILTVSEHSRQDIVKYYGLDASKITITHNAVSDRFHPHISKQKIESTQKKYGITSPYILNLNNFKPHKNPRGLIDAYAQLSPHIHQSTHLIIGGKHNAFTPSLRQHVETLELSHAIHFPGLIDDNDLPALYAGATLFVIPSFYEGFGIPPLEAMASGTPVISSHTTSLPEVVGDAALMFSPQNTPALTQAITQFLEDKSLRQTYIQKGLERAQLFTQENVAQKILNALEKTAYQHRTHAT